MSSYGVSVHTVFPSVLLALQPVDSVLLTPLHLSFFQSPVLFVLPASDVSALSLFLVPYGIFPRISFSAFSLLSFSLISFWIFHPMDTSMLLCQKSLKLQAAFPAPLERKNAKP